MHERQILRKGSGQGEAGREEDEVAKEGGTKARFTTEKLPKLMNKSEFQREEDGWR